MCDIIDHFGLSKVDDFDILVTGVCEQNVFRLQIAVDYLYFGQMREAFENLQTDLSKEFLVHGTEIIVFRVRVQVNIHHFCHYQIMSTEVKTVIDLQ